MARKDPDMRAKLIARALFVFGLAATQLQAQTRTALLAGASLGLSSQDRAGNGLERAQGWELQVFAGSRLGSHIAFYPRLSLARFARRTDFVASFAPCPDPAVACREFGPTMIGALAPTLELHGGMARHKVFATAGPELIWFAQRQQGARATAIGGRVGVGVSLWLKNRIRPRLELAYRRLANDPPNPRWAWTIGLGIER
jgi:hypothetical protein